MKTNKKTNFFIVMEAILILLIIWLSVLYMKSEHHLTELKNQLSANSSNSNSESFKVVQTELTNYREAAEDQTQRTSEALSLVKNFLRAYYECDVISPYARLMNSAHYLNDNALRQLCPYVHDPKEITHSLLEQIRNQDSSLLTPEESEESNRTNYILNMELYYRGNVQKKEQVLAYFTLETRKKGSDYSNKSIYLFECTIGESEEKLVITDILIRSPVILPTYDSEAMIFQ